MGYRYAEGIAVKPEVHESLNRNAGHNEVNMKAALSSKA
jgi:hypothetical protein